MIDLKKYDFFLKDWEIYKENKELWQKTINQLSKSNSPEWVITMFANGEDFFDGNPIYSALINKTNKAIRIIQLENKIENPVFASWNSKVELEDTVIDELVIALILNEQTFKDAEYLIKLFLLPDKSSFLEQLMQLNEAYSKLNTEREQIVEKINAYKIKEEALEIINEAYLAKIEALELLNRNLKFLREIKNKGRTTSTFPSLIIEPEEEREVLVQHHKKSTTKGHLV